MSEKLEISVRKVCPADTDYITSTWLKSVYEHHKHDFKKSVFFPNHNKMVKDRMPLMKCLVACNPDDSDQIYGYLVYNLPGVIHFAYTKSFFRRLGVFKTLLEKAELNQKDLEITHKGPMYQFLTSKYPITFNPYKFYEVQL